jgi:hypothetical protein
MRDSMTYNRDLWALISYFLDGLAIILTLTGVVLLAIYLASEVDTVDYICGTKDEKIQAKNCKIVGVRN